MHIMIDFETLGDALTGKIASVSYKTFSFDTEDSTASETHYFDIALQDDYVIDDETIEWWKKQDKGIFLKAVSGLDKGYSLDDFCQDFTKFIFDTDFDWKNGDCIWSRGINFDLTIIDRIFKDTGNQLPFPYWCVRDSRTFIDAGNLSTNNYKDNKNFPFIGKNHIIERRENSHSAEDDVNAEIIALKYAYNKIKEK